MKFVLLSADNRPSVYSVPDMVADNLKEYCFGHFFNWLNQSPQAKKHHTKEGYCYDETAFIQYLNFNFPNETSMLVETLDWVHDRKDIPSIYKDCEWLNF